MGRVYGQTATQSYSGLELHHLSPTKGTWVFDHHDFTIPKAGLLETTRSGQGIVDHGGAITFDGAIWVSPNFVEISSDLV